MGVGVGVVGAQGCGAGVRYDERGNETRTNSMEQNETKSRKRRKMKKNLGF